MLDSSWFFALIIPAAAVVAIFASRSKVADSPWFWVYIFSTTAAAALFVMDGKYNHRQGHIEDEYRYGTKTVAKPSPDAVAAKIPDASERTDDGDESAPLASGPQPPTHELLISLAPLRTLALIVMIVSCLALQWRRIKLRTGKV